MFCIGEQKVEGHEGWEMTKWYLQSEAATSLANVQHVCVTCCFVLDPSLTVTHTI